MKNIHQFVTGLAIIISAAIVAGCTYVLGNQFLRNQAINGCLQTSLYRSERIENDITITTEEPIASAVATCLELKNIK